MPNISSANPFALNPSPCTEAELRRNWQRLPQILRQMNAAALLNTRLDGIDALLATGYNDIGKAKADIAAGGSGTIVLWSGAIGSEAASAVEVTAADWLGTGAKTGDTVYVLLTVDGKRYFVVSPTSTAYQSVLPFVEPDYAGIYGAGLPGSSGFVTFGQNMPSGGISTSDKANNKCVAGAAGDYLCRTHVHIAASGGALSVQLVIRINDNVEYQVATQGLLDDNNYHTVAGEIILTLAAADDVQVYAHLDTSYGYSGEGQLTIQRLG